MAVFPPLLSGGAITNYSCTSSCRHCLYCSSPRRSKRYMTPSMAAKVFETARRLGCSSMHVGGGEPFLRFRDLLDVCLAARDAGVSIEYVETNSSWFRGQEETEDRLRQLQDVGVGTILVSISPFHDEFIPFRRVQGVLAACRKTGMGVFPWILDFKQEIEALDTTRPHGLDEFEQVHGPGYVRSVWRRYWIVPRGRAIASLMELEQGQSVDTILAGAGGGCRELLDTSHFHMDLYGNYIPGLCAGLAVALDDMDGRLDPGRYPVLTRLLHGGVAALLEYAGRVGFEPTGRYLSKCHLCQEARRHLILAGEASADLAPSGFYRELASQSG